MAKAKPAAKAAEKKTANVPAVKQNTAVSTEVIDFSQDAGAGLEGADKDSYAIPFLAVLQPMSPAVVDGDVDGAKPGKFINTVSLECFEKPIVIPCAFQRRWLRWTPREVNGGGFKGELTTAEVNALRASGTVKEMDGRLYFPAEDGSINPKKQDRLADTRSHFVLIVDGADAEVGVPAVFAVTSTGIKTSKNWLARIESTKMKVGERTLTAPSFSQAYELSTEKKTNDKGTWWVPLVSPLAQISNPNLYAQAKAFNAQINAGQVQVAHDSMERAGESSNADPEKF